LCFDSRLVLFNILNLLGLFLEQVCQDLLESRLHVVVCVYQALAQWLVWEEEQCRQCKQV